MANTNDFFVQLMAQLDTSSTNAEMEKLKKRLANDPIIQKVTLDTSMSKQAIKEMSVSIHKALQDAFRNTGIDNFDISIKEVEKILGSAVTESNRLSKEMENASLKAQKFLAQFNKKSGGTLINSKEFQDVQNAINGLGNTHSIDELNKAMLILETTYNNMVSNLRNNGKSLNPFINAINEMGIMDDIIKGIGLEFDKLSNKPKNVTKEIRDLTAQQAKVNSFAVGTQEWATAYGELQRMITKVKIEISNLAKAQSAKSPIEIFNIADLKNQGKIYFTKVRNTLDSMMPDIQRKFKNLGFSEIDVKGVQDATGKIKEFTVTAKNAVGEIQKFNFERAKIEAPNRTQGGFVQTGSIQVIKTATQAQAELTSQTEKANQELAEQQQKLANEIKLSIGTDGKTSSSIEILRTNFTKLGLSTDEVKSKMQNLDSEFGKLQSLMNQGASNEAIVSQFQRVQTALSQTQNNLKSTRAEYSLLVTEQQRLSKANEIEAWNQKNTRASKEVIKNNEAYIASLRDLNSEMTKMQFNKINQGFKQSENSMRALGKLGQSLKDQFTQAYQSFSMWLSASSAVMKVVSEIREAVVELKEIDTLLTEISKANDNLSKDELEQIGDNSFDVASKYGKSAKDYLSGVQEASRAGYQNAESIAELSTAAQGAGDMTAELANQMIIATDKAYKLGGSTSELTKILDGMNYITNHNAVNMTELSEGMSIVGSTAASFGIEANELTAALATMSATTQQSGSEVARAFRAILLNIRQVSDEEENIDAEGLTRYEQACNALGVTLKETVNGVQQLRDPMEVLKELSIEYNKLSEKDVKRTNLLNSVGGKLRSTQLDALLRQWSTYETMLQQYEDGVGSMAVEAEKTAQSWEGSANRLSNTWKDTVENVLNSDAIITAINTFNDFLQIINKATDSLGSLGTIGVGAGLFAGLKNVGKPKMFGFNYCFEIADFNMCSLGY